MAEGRTNRAIGEQLFLSTKTLENHVGQIFQKLGFQPSTSDHRRIGTRERLLDVIRVIVKMR